MEENLNMNLETKKKEIEEQMMRIYSSYQQDENNPVSLISYYNQLVFKDNQSQIMYGLQETFAVTITQSDNTKLSTIIIQQEGKQIATIDENSNIIFSEDYLMQMKEVNLGIYKLLQGINGKHFELPDVQQEDDTIPSIADAKEQVENCCLTKEELEQHIQSERNIEHGQTDNNKENNEDKKQEVEEPENEEGEIAQIAVKSGLTKDDIKSCATINPKEKITDAESFENIANVTGQYSKIFVVASNSKTEGNSRFAFWGLTPDGQVEQISGLEERNGVNTGKTIYSINRDGTQVKEQQTAALFTLPNQKEGFSLTIGQYGIIEATYIRKSPEENKFIGSAINSSTQKPTTREVQEFMNDSRTNDRELQETIEKAEHQLSETQITNIRNIDDNEDNDKAIDIDEKITLHDGTVTTLREEAERLGISPEEYREEFEMAQGDCMTEKIEVVRLRYEQEEPDIAHSDRGERLTPEEQALRRLGY